MRTVVGLYDRFEDANAVIRALQDEGFARDDISLVARDATGEFSQYFQDHDINVADESTSGAAAGAGVGAVLGGLGGLLLGLGALAIPGVGPVLAAGPLMTALAGAGIGAVTGGLLGALVDLGIPEEHAQLYAEGVRRGGSLVVVRAADDHVEHARDILNRFNPIDIEERGSNWRSNNWGGFTESGQPLNADQMEFNRTDMYDRRVESTAMPVTGGTFGTDLHDATREVGNDVEEGVEGFHDNLKDVRREAGYQADRKLDDVSDSMRDVRHDVSNKIDDARDSFRDSELDINRSNAGISGQAERDFNRTASDLNDPMRDMGRDAGRAVDNAGDNLREMGQDVARGVDNMGDSLRSGAREIGNTFDREFDRFDMDYRNHYATTYGSMGHNYDYYQPAYRYGYQLAHDERYRGYDWDRLEMDARRDWQTRYHDTMWDDVKDAVRHAWNSITR